MSRFPERTEISLPSDVVRESHRRLGILALVYAGTYFIAAYLIPRPPVEAGRFFHGRTMDLSGVFFIVSSIGFFFLVRSGWLAPRALGTLTTGGSHPSEEKPRPGGSPQ